MYVCMYMCHHINLMGVMFRIIGQNEKNLLVYVRSHTNMCKYVSIWHYWLTLCRRVGTYSLPNITVCGLRRTASKVSLFWFICPHVTGCWPGSGTPFLGSSLGWPHIRGFGHTPTSPNRNEGYEFPLAQL